MNKIPTCSFLINASETFKAIHKIQNKHSYTFIVYQVYQEMCNKVMYHSMFVQRNRTKRMKRALVMFYPHRWRISTCKSVVASQ